MNAFPGNVSAPANDEAEAALLGALMVENSGNDAWARISGSLDVHHFRLEPHRIIFETVKGLHADGQVITPITVKNRLPGSMTVGDLTAPAYLLRLHADATSLINIADYARIIREMAVRRSLLETGANALDFAQVAGKPVMDSLDVLTDQIAELRRSLVVDEIPMDMRAGTDAFRRFLDGKAGVHEKGIYPCFSSLAEVLQDDLQVGQLYGLLAASGEGKTSLTLHLMRYAAEQGHPVAFMSRDQDYLKCVRQMCSQSLKIEEWRYRSGALSDDQKRRSREEADRLDRLPMAVIQFSRSRIDKVLSKADEFVSRWDRKTLKRPLVIIDHIRTLMPDDPRADHGTIAQVKNTKFKDWAVDRHAVALMVNQRNGQGNKDIATMLPRPTDMDLYGGEAAREDYDAILGLFRPEWWRDKALSKIPENEIARRNKIEERYGDCDGKVEINLVKARHGNPRKRCTLKFEGVYTRVSEFESEQPSLLEEGAPF